MFAIALEIWTQLIDKCYCVQLKIAPVLEKILKRKSFDVHFIGLKIWRNSESFK